MLSVKFHVAHRIGMHDEPFCGAFSYDDGTDRYALAVGDCDIPFSNIWADSLARGFVHFEYPIENSREFLYRFLNEARQSWIESVNWSDQRWFVKNKALRGCFSSFIGISVVEREDSTYLIRGFSSGYNGLLGLTHNGNMISVQGQGSKPDNRGFWSGYSPPMNREYHWEYDKPFYFSTTTQEGSVLVMTPPELADWLIDNPADNIRSIFDSYNPSEFLRKLMKTGLMNNTDTVLAIIGAD